MGHSTVIGHFFGLGKKRHSLKWGVYWPNKFQAHGGIQRIEKNDKTAVRAKKKTVKEILGKKKMGYENRNKGEG